MKQARILIINIFGIGDVLFATPLIANLKKHRPDLFIGFVCNRRTVPLLENHPHIDKTFVYERDDYRRLSRWQAFMELRRYMKEIKKECFDMVLDLSLNPYASFLMWIIGIKERVGFEYKNRGFFLTKKLKIKGYENKHVVEYYLNFLEEMGLDAADKNLGIPVQKQDIRWVDALFSKQHISNKDIVVGVVPGGGASWGKNAIYKHWAAEKYAQLADKMIEKFSAKVILLGDRSEEQICIKVAKSMKRSAIVMVGQTTLNQLAAVLKRCSLAIVNDGGPLHMAVAVGTKTISIFGPVDENVYGPYPSNGHLIVTNNVACRPCYRHFRMADCQHYSCINKITVDQVFEKVESLL